MPDRIFVPAVVAAGFPSPGQEWKEHLLDVRQLLGLAAEKSSVRRMAGSALSGVGVHDKDLLLLSSLVEPETNDIVVAQVNGSIYIRRFVCYTHVIFLLPTDGQHPPIRIEAGDQFHVIGVVLCSIHPVEPHAQQDLRLCQLQLAAVNTVLGLHEPSVYCSQVRGHSMHDAGIYEGDVLVIDRGRAARAYDIIIASWQGGYVVKRLLQAHDTVFLLSDNPLIPPMYVTAESGFQVWGIVTYSLHPLHTIVKQRLVAHHQQQRARYDK
jgi:SOS-response transcriptional repressor LexA